MMVWHRCLTFSVLRSLRVRKPRISAPIRQKAFCCSGVRTWRRQEGTIEGNNTHSDGIWTCFKKIHTRLNLARGLPTTHEGANRKTGDWTEGGDTLDFTGLGKPGETNWFFLSGSQKMQVVENISIHSLLNRTFAPHLRVAPFPKLITFTCWTETLDCDSKVTSGRYYCSLNKQNKCLKS